MEFKVKRNELYHHGIKGMKWGVWNNETAARYAGSPSTSTAKIIMPPFIKTISPDKKQIKSALKPGKDGKPSAAEKGVNELNNIVSTADQIHRKNKANQYNELVLKQKKERLKEIEKMSDQDLQYKVNRLQKENQLNDLLQSREGIKQGRDILDGFFSVAVPLSSMAASAVTIAAMIYKIKHGL